MAIILRKYNAGRNRGELNCQFKEWIINNEAVYSAKIADIYKVGYHKVQLAYYGMVFTILKWTGCYHLGKRGLPLIISLDRYCKELNLNKRLKSNNVRKTLANPFYGHNYLIRMASKEKGRVKAIPLLDSLEPIFKSLYRAIIDSFL